MNNNVFILGAGFSADAGIPLLGNFAQLMWDIAARNAYNGKALSEEDRRIFAEAAKIRRILDAYHGRANFSDRNIEDILSILAISAHANDADAQKHLASFRMAIARTIELTCKVVHPGLRTDGRVEHRPDGMVGWYLDFWRALFRWAGRTNQVPTIITFNYDLVLERSLFHILNGTHLGHEKGVLFPWHHLRVSYHDAVLKSALFEVRELEFGFGPERKGGAGMVCSASQGATNELQVEILKLHGSVNFPRDPGAARKPETTLVTALDDPDILPPIFNKLSNASHAGIWEIALQRLKQAKRITIVGYSLPQTDIYMQYFLKAGLGPNQDFDKITVYDPAFFVQGDASERMRSRYARCFSEQLQPRIDFTPALAKNNRQSPHAERYLGTAYDFICKLNNNPEEILF